MSDPRVLVADDEKSMRDLLAITLQKAGYDVTLAEGGAAAMEAIRRDPFDAIITGPCDETEHLLEGRLVGQAPEIDGVSTAFTAPSSIVAEAVSRSRPGGDAMV